MKATTTASPLVAKRTEAGAAQDNVLPPLLTERDEIKALKRETYELRGANEILKAVAGRTATTITSHHQAQVLDKARLHR